jgi:hypothetical protein
MKARLMHADRDFDARVDIPRWKLDVSRDLALDTLWRAMANEDKFLFDVAYKALLTATDNNLETVRYRQEVVADALRRPGVFRELYGLAQSAIEGRRKSHWSFSGRHLASMLYGAIEVLQVFTTVLEKMKAIADAEHEHLESRAMQALLATLRAELGESYIAGVRAHLRELKFDRGMLMRAVLGPGNGSADYTLLQAPPSQPWIKRLLGLDEASGYTFDIDPRDEAGAKALSELRNAGIRLVTHALMDAMDHIYSFFDRLHTELAFYICCLNLHVRLESLDAPLCYPDAQSVGVGVWRGDGLYDPSLALSLGSAPVGNALAADGVNLVVITGANQGGKSSFLRALGLAQVMMQAGMFVAAKSFAAGLRTGVFTHYKREEDVRMTHGKFDEELARMSGLIDSIRPGALVLFNESFASTDEREGSEIARQIVAALRERGVKVCFVTHLYEFAHGLFVQHLPDALFLRAERREDGTRTFHLTESEPLATSFGADLYREIFAKNEVSVPVN